MNDAATPTQLLVSVRSAAEAWVALAGGAALIDIKEPARGSLGRADATVIQDVVAAVNGRRPVSAALGEWADEIGAIPDADLTYVKWGLAGCARRPTWRRELTQAMERQKHPQPVLVAYADWQCAQAPSVEEVFALAREHPGSVMLVDTHCKEAGGAFNQRRPTLLDWLPSAWIEDLCARCREAHVSIALAGSLGMPEIRTLLPARPNWFAVRGAVCSDQDRQATVQLEKVRQLGELLQVEGVMSTSAN
jgi:(5-formylfuran-3-yl)methyl phosphate synthase